MSNQEILNGLINFSSDRTKSVVFDVNTGLNINYDLNTSNPKTFKINSSGFNFTDNTNNDTTGLQRIALVQKAFSSVELPPNVSTLSINKNIKLNDTLDNNIIYDEASNNIPYPFTNPSSDFQTRITKQTDDNLEIGHLQNIHLRKNVTPSYNINDLNVSDTTLLSTIPTTNPASTFSNSVRAVFQQNNKVIWAAADATTFTKEIYIQNFADSLMTTVNLTSLTTGADNYLARLGSIFISQFIPVYYNSQTDCKFFIRLLDSTTRSHLYIITCNGDPTLLTSYTYSVNYLSNANPTGSYLRTNGTSWFPLTSCSNAQALMPARPHIQLYDEVNDVFIIGNSSSSAAGLTTRYMTVVNTQLTGFASYSVVLPPAITTSVNSPLFQGHPNTSSIATIYNNNLTTQGQLCLYNNNKTTKTLTISAFRDVQADYPSQYMNTINYQFDSYTIESGGLLYFYYISVNNAVATNLTFDLICYSWDKTSTSSPLPIFRRTFQTLGNISPTSGSIYYSYVSPRVYDLNNMEVFSTFNVSNNATMFISNNAFSTFISKPVTGFLTGIINCAQMEADISIQDYVGSTAIIYPQHICIRGPTGSVNSSVTDVKLITVSSTSVSAQDYLTFDYNLTTNTGSIISTKPITLQANPLKITGAEFTNLPTCSVVPTTSSQLVNKNYVDGLISTPTLTSVLTTGNSAGTNDINMNDNDLLNVTSITSTSDLTLNPVGSIQTGGKTLNMGGGQIHNVDLLHSNNNNDITIEGKGTGDIILKTNAVNQVIISDIGVTTFTNLPECSSLPSTSNQFVNKNYVDTNALLLAGAQTITGDKTISGNTSITGNTLISGQCQLLKLIEQTRLLTGGATVTFDYSQNVGCVGYIATNHTANFQLNITNLPTTTNYPNGVITLTLLINSSTNKFYANAVTINGGAAETIRFNGGSVGINVSSAIFILQTITIINNSNNKIVVLSSVSSWY